MARQFDIGRQNETLMNEEHYKIFKVLQNYLSDPNSATAIGPSTQEGNDQEVIKKALWLDTYTNPNTSDLKYFDGNTWNVVFKDKFKVTQDLLSKDQPKEPIVSQLWIDNGIMKYYENGEFKPIQAVPFDSSQMNPLGYEDFIIISGMEASSNRIVDNFSEFLFAETPIVQWTKGKEYKLHEGAISDLGIYICRKAHTSSDEITIDNREYWEKLEFLTEFLVPNSFADKFFINGNFVHKKEDWVLENGLPDPSDAGYNIVTNTCVSFPVEMINGKTPSAIHVNPSRLNNMYKKFIKIDKANPVIEVPEENTEYYGVQGSIGKLLNKTNSDLTTEYFSVVSNDINCIKLSSSAAEKYDFIYCIHYEFSKTSVKQPGVLTKKKFKLQDDNYVWIGQVNPDNIAVFAQGLFYENTSSNYRYDASTGYLFISEKLQDVDNVVKSYDFSVMTFPKIVQGKVTDNFSELGYRINLPEELLGDHLIAFVSGVQLHTSGLEVTNDPEGNPLVKYIPGLTREQFVNDPNIYWAIAQTGEIDRESDTFVDMYRASTKAVDLGAVGVGIPIYRNPEKPVEGSIYLAEDEYPILFVDGVATFQKEIEIENNYMTIYGLKAGQDVLVLADRKSSNQSEEENSDSILFEDAVAYATIPTDLSDSTIVYMQNGILCDSSAVYTSAYPKDKGYHGEIRFVVNYNEQKWVEYDGLIGEWKDIDPNETITNSVNGESDSLIEILEYSSRGYSASKKSVSFIQNLGKEVVTYYAYRFSDSIEKPLIMDYCYPNGVDGVNNDYPKDGEPSAFAINYRHAYTPGKNELTVYLNGVRQNLLSPYDVAHPKSKNKECRTDRNSEFTLAIDDGTDMGEAIKAYEGYYVYYANNGLETKVITKTVKMGDDEKASYENEGYIVDLISSPNRNVVLYVIEQCETGETKACERKRLTYKDAMASKGAFSNNSYDTGNFALTRGNLRVFINGVRQPNGAYQTLELQEQSSRSTLTAYNILDAYTLQINSPLIGGMGGNIGDINNPLYPLVTNIDENGNTVHDFYDVIDEIVVETRNDFKLREVTLPIRDNTGEFTEADGVPADLFKSKDRVMIYINGLAYGKEYKIENNTIRLLNEDIKLMLGNSKSDVITFEWR